MTAGFMGSRETNACKSDTIKPAVIDRRYRRRMPLTLGNMPLSGGLHSNAAPRLLRQRLYAPMKQAWSRLLILLLTGSCVVIAQQSPASRRPPQTVNPQSYSREQVMAGQTRFASQCAFCHGRDTAGAETG